MLSDEEKKKIVVDWNDNFTKYPKNSSVKDLFEEISKKYPKNIALKYQDKKITYFDLNQRANQLAHYLKEIGVKKQEFIGIFMDKSIDLIIGILAIIKIGGIYVPIDISYPDERKHFILKDAKIKVLLTQEDFVSNFELEKLNYVCLRKIKKKLENVSSKNLRIDIDAKDVAYVNYTSGSTGLPKGVEVVNRGIIRLVRNTNWIEISPKDKLLQISNISFDAATFEIWGSLLNGATLCIYNNKKIFPDELSLFIFNEKVTQVMLTAKLFNLMIDEQIEKLNNLKYLFSVGEIMSVFHARKAFKVLDNCKIINGYGPTENTTFTCTYAITNSVKDEGEIPIGKPISNTSIYILDKNLEPIPVGVVGDLYTGGDGLAKGYLNQKELTNKKFIKNPFSKIPHSKMYKTGDLAKFLPDGNILFVGREDRQVKINGFRIELGEIENTIIKNENVKDCVVLTIQSPSSEKVLVAYIESFNKISEKNIRDFLSSLLPKYMIPSFYIFLDKIPINHNGKKDLKVLPSPFKSLEMKKDKPKTSLEKQVLKIWSKVLGYKNIGRDDNFFRIGGDSIKAMQVTLAIKKTINPSLKNFQLFENCIFKDFVKNLDNQNDFKTTIRKRVNKSPTIASENQESLWILDRLNPSSLSYVLDFPFILEGNLDVKKTIQALDIIIQRHESLRTYFGKINNELMQYIEENISNYFEYFECDSEKEAKKILESKVKIPIDLKKCPLFFFYLIKTNDEKYFALFKIHHIIFDGWSSDIFFQEWNQIYSNLLHNEDSKLPVLKIQYADFAIWQRKHINEEYVKQQINYWKKKLNNIPEFLKLPYDHSRPAVFSNKGKTYYFSIPKQIIQNLMNLAKELGITYYILTLSVFYIFLNRVTGQKDLCIGTPYANRNQPNLESIIGFFVQILVIRNEVDENDCFEDFSRKIFKTVTEAYNNSDVTFENLVAHLNPERNPSFNPIFQVGFSVENAATYLVNLENIKTDLFCLENNTAKFDFYLALTESEGGYVNYCSNLFEEDTIERMMGCFEQLLDNVSKNPIKPIKNYSMISQKEKEEIIFNWNETSTKYPKDSSVKDLFEEISKKYPKNIALEYKDEKITYFDLNQRANQLAHYLKEIGVEKQEFVGISMEKSIDLIIGILAIIKVGGIYVPIDMSYPDERKSFIVKDAKIKVLLTQEEFIENFILEKLNFVCLRKIEKKLKNFSTTNLKIDIDALDIAYVNYTSGSTGIPKGVEVVNRGIVRLVKNTNWIEISQNDRILQISNISFDAATFEIWGSLLNGASLCIYPYKKLVPDELGNFISNKKLSHLFFTTKLFNLMIDEQIEKLKKLKYCIFGGELMSIIHSKKAFNSLSKCKILHAYGPTENTTFSTIYFISNLKDIENGVPIGKPISNTSIYILDENLEPVPVGVVGEIYTGGDGIAKGYLNQKKMTKEKFIKDPFSKNSNAKMYKSGDLAKFLPDGNIMFAGRSDFQVKIRGFRIELQEIEQIVKKNENINNCVCILCEDAKGERQIALYVEGSKDLTNETLRDDISQKMPKYMIPDFIIILEKIPVNNVGKIDRKALSSPKKFLSEMRDEFIAPESSLEILIADIWATTLNIEKVSRHDNFFHIGGHSINATQMASFLSKTLEKEIPVTLIFEYSVLEDFSTEVEKILQTTKGKRKKKILLHDFFWIWRNKEVKLDKNIGSEKLLNPSEKQYKNPENIFITGASGFVGVFVLQDLLENTKANIFCHVRAKSKEDGFLRIKSNMKKYEIWRGKYEKRIFIVIGDLEKKLIGIDPEYFEILSMQIDSIFHIGAYVNHVLPYDRLKAANVLGTEEIIKLAMHKKIKPLHFTSTAAVFDLQNEIMEDEDLNKCKNLFNGYAQTKWVDEKILLLARKRGLFVNIHRLGRIIGSSKNAAGPTSDFLWLMIFACIYIKAIPKIGYAEPLIPVDYLAKSIVNISKKEKFINKQYNLLNTEGTEYFTIFQMLKKIGYSFKTLDYESWRKILLQKAGEDNENILKGLIPLFTSINFSEMSHYVNFRCDNVIDALKASSTKCPKFDEKSLKKYLKYYIKIGFLPPYA